MIQPLGKKLLLKIEKPVVGGLDLSSKETVTEYGEVVAVGELVTNLKVGDKILAKAWQFDVISHEGENYTFINSDGDGICAVVK